MRWISTIGFALALGLAGPAAAQDSPSDDIDLEALLGDGEPKGEAPAAESTTEAAPEAAAPALTDQQKADLASLDQVSYATRSLLDAQYYGHTLVRAARHEGHLDVFFITKEGQKMMAEARPDGSLGKVEKASF